MGASTAQQSEFPEPGEVFAQRYRILHLIGKGGFSRVYSARQGQLDRDVAIKVLAPPGVGSRSSQEVVEKRFYREARFLSRLSGPNTITVFDYGRASTGLLFMVSELIDGENLKQLLEAEGSLPEPRARRIFSQILLGLSEVHAHGFLHRDIKPSNVMVFDEPSERDRAKLLDFGIAKGVTVGAGDATALTMAGFVIGTPGYMSPEQALGRPVSRASDVFSAALVAYETLTGQSPFRGMSLEQLQRRLMSEPLRLPGTVEISDDFEQVLYRALAIDPDERYETAAEALADLGVADADYSEVSDDQSTPRPANLITFPMQLDPSGSTIVDTLTDAESGEAQTILLPSADTFEETAPEPSTIELADERLAEASEVDRRQQNARTVHSHDPAERTLPGTAQENKTDWTLWLIVAGAGIIIALVAISLATDDTEQPAPEPDGDKSGAVTPPDRLGMEPADSTPALQAAQDILTRASRNAELDAQIRAKEDRLSEEEQEVMEFEEPEVRDEPPRPVEPDGRPEPHDVVEPDVVEPDVVEPEDPEPTEPPAEEHEMTEPEEPDSEETKPADKPKKRDFNVKPIDEL